MISRISRIFLAAVVAESLAILALMAVIVFVFASQPLSLGQGERLGHEISSWVIPTAGFASCLFGGWWAARKLGVGQIRQGFLVGMVAAVLDIVFLAWLGAPIRFVFVVATLGRLAGGALGGRLASRSGARKAVQAAVAR